MKRCRSFAFVLIQRMAVTGRAPLYRKAYGVPVIAAAVLALTAALSAQTPAGDCDLVTEQAALADQLADFAADAQADPNKALAALYQTGLAYQQLAVRCGYQLSEEERLALAKEVLTLVDLPTLLRANTVGTDVTAIMDKLKERVGDSINGQLLYNGMETAADGTALGCSGCHEAGGVAPSTEGTWTRVTEQRLKEPQFKDYDFVRYIVESIVLPNAYTPPDHAPFLMPDNFGQRLSLQNLADLIAYLESQDQEIEK